MTRWPRLPIYRSQAGGTPSDSGAQCTPLWHSAARQRLRTAPPSGPCSAVGPSKAMPSSAITTSAIFRPDRRIEPGLEVGKDRIKGGAERYQKTVGALAVSLTADIAFPKTRDNAPQVSTVAADIAAVPEILRMGGGVAVEALQHIGDVPVDVMKDAECERLALWSRQ